MTRERRAELRHAGGMRFETTTGTGRTIVFGDDKGANEQSPVEMVTAAIAACSAMDVVSILEKKRQVVTDYTIRVSATQRDEYPQILTEVVVVHEVSGPEVTEAAVRRAVELSATKYCPVSAMLSAGDTTVHHRYVVRGTGDVPLLVEGEAVVTGPFRRPEIVA
jgi:putative redox protein